jgi:hypothetical protein
MGEGQQTGGEQKEGQSDGRMLARQEETSV